MLQERKGFFYEPELLDYKPVYARPDMNIMLKIIEAGAEKVAHQQDMLNKVEDSVRKTPAYLDQDVDYVGNVTKQIDTEISGMMDGTVDLLDPANTGKVMQIAKRYMYDPELAKITSRTGKISKSQEQIEAMRKANKISAANYWEFNQSILGANEAFAKDKKYNSDVNLHYDIVPYGDVAAESMKVVAATKTYKNTYTVHGADGYIRTETIDAANTDVAAEMYNAAINKDAAAYEKAKQLNDDILTNQFMNTLSGEALGQLKAEAKMLGIDPFDHIKTKMKGYVEMVNGYSHTVDGMVFDKNIEMKTTYDNAVKLKQIDYAHARNLQQMKDAAEAIQKEKDRQHALKLAGMRKGKGGSSGEDGEDGEDGGLIGNAYRNVPVTGTALTIPARKEMFGIPKEQFTYAKVTSLITTKELSLKNANKQAFTNFQGKLMKGDYPGLKGGATITTDPTTGKLKVVVTTANRSDPKVVNSLQQLESEITHHNASIDATLISVAEMKNWKTAQDNAVGVTPQDYINYDKIKLETNIKTKTEYLRGIETLLKAANDNGVRHPELEKAVQAYYAQTKFDPLISQSAAERESAAWDEYKLQLKKINGVIIPASISFATNMTAREGTIPALTLKIEDVENNIAHRLQKAETEVPKLKTIRKNIDASFVPTSVIGPAYSLKGVGIAKGYTDDQMKEEVRAEVARNSGRIIDNTTGEAAPTSAMPLIYKTIKEDAGAVTIAYNETTGKFEGVVTTAQVDNKDLNLSYRFPISDKLLDYFGLSDMQNNQMNIAIDARLNESGLAPVPGSSAVIKRVVFSPNTSERTNVLNVYGIDIPITELGVTAVTAATEIRKIEGDLLPLLLQAKDVPREKKIEAISTSLTTELKCTPTTAAYIADRMLTNQENQ